MVDVADTSLQAWCRGGSALFYIEQMNRANYNAMVVSQCQRHKHCLHYHCWYYYSRQLVFHSIV